MIFKSRMIFYLVRFKTKEYISWGKKIYFILKYRIFVEWLLNQNKILYI